MIKTRWGLSLAGLMVMWTIGIFAHGASGSAPLGLDRFVFAEPDSTPVWVQRIARVDAALARSNGGRRTGLRSGPGAPKH